ncbi:hypothetical protein HYV43_01830 [Candidatus Micrarchaeota archaeon]|nr:hypothetical protein [Candidatus Micrarchaeota archaeon]
MVLPILGAGLLAAAPTVLTWASIAGAAYVVGEEVVKPITQPQPTVQVGDAKLNISPLLIIGAGLIAFVLLTRK